MGLSGWRLEQVFSLQGLTYQFRRRYQSAPWLGIILLVWGPTNFRLGPAYKAPSFPAYPVQSWSFGQM